MLHRADDADELTGMLDVFRNDEAVELVPLFAAARQPSGAIAADCADALSNLLRGQLRSAGAFDAICFSLHGAMTGENTPDLDGHFLQVMREEVGASIPIVCSLDCHATVTRQMVELSTALTAYRTHPHTDGLQVNVPFRVHSDHSIWQNRNSDSPLTAIRDVRVSQFLTEP